MAFTLREFRSGAWEAWLLFQAVAPIIAFVGGGIAAQHDPYVVEQAGIETFVGYGFGSVVWGGLFGAPSSFIALALGAPFAYMLGHALRRTASEGIHFFAFALLGLVIGGATALGFTALMGQAAARPAIMVPLALAAGVVVPCGQYRASRRALRADAVALSRASAAASICGEV